MEQFIMLIKMVTRTDLDWFYHFFPANFKKSIIFNTYSLIEGKYPTFT